MSAGSAYSSFVRVAKIVLPLVALVILTLLFLLAEELDPEAAIPYAEVDVERILREQGMTGPEFGGVTSDGTRMAFDARRLRPETPGAERLRAEIIEGGLELAGGGKIAIEGSEGMFDMTAGKARLSGGVTVRESGGHVVQTEEIELNWQTGRLSTPKIQAEGPLGRLEAGAMRLTGKDGTHFLVFDGGVRLIYDPNPEPEDDRN